MTDAYDIRERFFDFDEILETLKDDVKASIRKALPVIVNEDSKDGHTVSLKSALKAVQRMPDGSSQLIEFPVLPDIPIHHSGAGGVTQTHAHKKGDEGILIISDAGISFWHQQGGVQPSGDASQHPLSEAFYIPGVRSDPRKLQGVSTNSTQTRTDDKKSVHDVSHTAVTAVRERSAHQVNGMAVQSEKGGSQHVVDAQGIQQRGGQFFWNC